jgi:hypothetical protein
VIALRFARARSRVLGLWLLLATGLCASARADASPLLGRDNPLAALLPSGPALRARAQKQRAQQIERALMRYPSVRGAEVLITEPELGSAPLDQAAPGPHVNVRLEVLLVRETARFDARAGAPSDVEIVRLVHTALPEVAPADVHVLRSRAQAPPEVSQAAATARVGPFLVARESAALLRATLAVCLTANALLAALVLARRRVR